jgi:hypothetical protein
MLMSWVNAMAIIETERERRSVEISAAQHLSRFLKDQRIVGRRSGFDFNDGPDVIESAAHRTVHLRHAPQRISILHTRIVDLMRTPDLTICDKLSQVRCRRFLACVRPGVLDSGIECGWRSQQSFETHRAG